MNRQEFVSAENAKAKMQELMTLNKRVGVMLEFLLFPTRWADVCWLWENSKSEAMHISSQAPRVSLKGKEKAFKEDFFAKRNAFADLRANVVLSNSPEVYRHGGHAEEFMIHDFPECAMRVDLGKVQIASITLTDSPCMHFDRRPSNSIGGIYRGLPGCFFKLVMLAGQYPKIEFQISFMRGFGVFQTKPEDAATKMNRLKIRKNIYFRYDPEPFSS